MKTYFVLLLALFIGFTSAARNSISVNDRSVVHLLCPAGVSYVQVGNADMIIAETIADFPNLVRIKALEVFADTTSLTIVCQDKLYAFEVVYDKVCPLKLNLNQFKGEAISVLVETTMSIHQIQSCIELMQTIETKRSISKVKGEAIELLLEIIRVKHDLLFMRLRVKNKSNLIYRAECPSFLMRDKRPKKAANVQEYPMVPIKMSRKELFITPQNDDSIILVFKSFSIPKHKEIEIMLREKTDGYTGRDLMLHFNNKAIVKAKQL